MDPLPALAKVEQDEGVAVLLAIESGSRAWGFASPDSDWDVRFLYARPTLWHLGLHDRRDVIERSLPDDLDLSGWDMRKTLGLLLRGNCTIREWLASPIRYRSEPAFVDDLRRLADQVPGRRAALHHYRSLAEQVQARWLQRSPVQLKKYLYAVRPALALRWLRVNGTGFPPMDVPTLRAGAPLSNAERDALDGLLCQKALASEIGSGDTLPALDDMIRTEVLMAEAAAVSDPRLSPDGALVEEANRVLVRAAEFADQRVATRNSRGKGSSTLPSGKAG